jgi:hypothetical protein
MFYKIKIYNRAGPGPQSETAAQARPGTIKRVVLRANPLGTTHLAIYNHISYSSTTLG